MIDPSKVMAALAALVMDRRGAFFSRSRFAIVLVEGEAYVLDPLGAPTLSEGWIDDPDVLMLTNRRTLADLLAGRFDPAAPQNGQLFLWSGDERPLRALSAALGGARSWLSVRAGG